MAPQSTPDQLQQSGTPEPRRPRKGMRVFVAATALAAAGVGFALAPSHGGGDKAKIVTTQPSPEASHSNEAFEQVLEKVTHPKVGDKFSVAQGIFKLKQGAKISDGHGNESVLAKAIDGIQNPAWAKANTLCFLQQKDQATCFDLSGNESYIEAVVPTPKAGLKEFPASSFTQENAAEATVTTVEGDGFAYGKVDNRVMVFDQYIAGRPSNEGDTLSNLPS